jgi:aspartate ammonia-lyase
VFHRIGEVTRTALRGVGNAALHNEELGFMGAAELARRAIETGKTIRELVAGESP